MLRPRRRWSTVPHSEEPLSDLRLMSWQAWALVLLVSLVARLAWTYWRYRRIKASGHDVRWDWKFPPVLLLWRRMNGRR